MAELIIISGGSYAGKTAIIDDLAARGFNVLPECAYEIIQELTDERGLEPQGEWRSTNPIDFQRRILHRQLARELDARNLDERYVFCDRSVLDGIAYLEIAGVDWPLEFEDLTRTAQYRQVFLLETLATYEDRSETGRTHTFEDSLAVLAHLHQIYALRSEFVTSVPQAPVEHRTEFVLRTLGLPVEA